MELVLGARQPRQLCGVVLAGIHVLAGLGARGGWGGGAMGISDAAAQLQGS
jgi:hypothetical protein